jgi:hypothetical protein
MNNSKTSKTTNPSKKNKELSIWKKNKKGLGSIKSGELSIYTGNSLQSLNLQSNKRWDTSEANKLQAYGGLHLHHT